MFPIDLVKILDVGCGAGDNARRLSSRGHKVWGITLSQQEAKSAEPWCEEVFVGDLDGDLPRALPAAFDGILLSHVLGHLAHPQAVLRRLYDRLRLGGLLFIAVPDMAHWRLRVRLLGSISSPATVMRIVQEGCWRTARHRRTTKEDVYPEGGVL